MRKTLRFIRRDFNHLRGNVIALVVIFGLIIVPSFYAWFNIAGSWDPYGNTGNLKVAIANTDEGYTSELVPVDINFGERVVSDLRETETFGYVVTDEQDAIEGVRSGEYYAAVVIPPEFSRDLMSTLSDSPAHPQVDFYQNEKSNSIATIVTDKSATQIEEDIDGSFARSVVDVLAGALDEFDGLLTDDQVMQAANKLDAAISGSVSTLGDLSKNVRAYASIVDSTRSLLDSGSGLASTSLGSAADVSASLHDTADGIRGVGSTLDGATDSINDALTKSVAGIDGISSSVDNAFATADGQVDKLTGGLSKAKDSVDAQIDLLQELSDRLGGTDTLYKSWEESFSKDKDGVSASYDDVHEVRLTIQGINQRVQQALSELKALSSELQKTIDDLNQGKTDARAAKDKIQGQVSDAKKLIDGLKGNYDSDVRQSLEKLANKVDQTAASADSILASLRSTLDAVDGAGKTAAGSLASGKGSLAKTADELDQTAAKLSDLEGQLSSALNSQNVQLVRDVLSGGAANLADFISAPISIDRNPIFAVENNGSAMAPFYTTLSIWIGGVILCALVGATPSERALRETGCGHGQSYVGRIFLFLVVGAMQTLLICGGDLFFLGVQCAHPWLFVMACLLSSFVYVNIIFSLTASFGDVGKAIAVVLMVLQVAGSGGTFPQQMLPQGFFQAAYPYLPFVHSANALRAAMFGIYQGDYWRELAILLSFAIPALVLGLVLRRPVIRLNHWFEHKLEETKLM